MHIENPEEDLDWADYTFKDQQPETRPDPVPTLTLEQQKTIAKGYYDKHQYLDAYNEYAKCLDLCEFRDDCATIYSNMSMCCLKLHMYERSMADIKVALERSQNTDIKPDIMIKLRYRLALSLAHLRDYEQALSNLKHLKKYCNTVGNLDFYKVCQ